MEKLNEFLEILNIEKEISLDDIPDLDLYMDQVIQLFEKKFNNAKRNDDEKVLTKTMINNYAKANLLFPIKNKKYTKEHLILLSLIYQLKGSLSINDIKFTLQGLNKRITAEDFDFYSFYSAYEKLVFRNVENFKTDIEEHILAANNELTKIEVNKQDRNDLERVLLISSLASLSNLYKRAAEKLVDKIIEQEKE
ncbi:DUF1836 domain-containing protein [Calidifontibacillus oryziterrae]|uniref:DUF1836 domain-containing protein n=1 Tax=Calidifontibacillus oryziterrae TaxID=1191699 RepID=UPI0003073464|nr:DUF1836 domain-containing protein [Calidifontibacillus oryziterrae]